MVEVGAVVPASFVITVFVVSTVEVLTNVVAGGGVAISVMLVVLAAVDINVICTVRWWDTKLTLQL